MPINTILCAIIDKSKYAERYLNKIKKKFNKTFAGRKNMLRGFKIYLV